LERTTNRKIKGRQNLPARTHAGKPVVLRKPDHLISNRQIDPDALRIIHRLRRQGFIAYLTGAAVQNLMQGMPPKDFDIVTDARPGQIKRRFANTFIIGRRFRLAHIHVRSGKYIEVATFRRDPKAEDEETVDSDKSWKKTYGSPREDAFRRDITINALFYDVIRSAVIDYVGGLKDLEEKRIRIIGDPSERFQEDPVRILRVVRHAARLGFDIERRTERAVISHRSLLAESPGARLFEELNKDLVVRTLPVFTAMQRYGLLKYVLGRVGEAYQSDDEMFSRLKRLLEIREEAVAKGFRFSQEELFALLFWPWAEQILTDEKEDLQKTLSDRLGRNQAGATLPRGLRAGSIQIMILLWNLIGALRSGRRRSTWRRRSHYLQASRLSFLIHKGRPPVAGESFDSLYREAFPSVPHRRRPRQRKRQRLRD
jgi:poly(A) polymerase